MLSQGGTRMPQALPRHLQAQSEGGTAGCVAHSREGEASRACPWHCGVTACTQSAPNSLVGVSETVQEL